MTVLKREDILKVSDIQIELVKVPEWGKDAEVYVKGMTASEREELELFVIKNRGEGDTVKTTDVRATLASMTICDEKGERLFTKKDIEALSKKSAAALQRVFAVAQKLSAITEKDVAELAEELKKDPFDASPSD